MRCLATALLLLPFAGVPALASGSIECSSADGEASVDLTIGSLPVLAVVGAMIDAGSESWILNEEGGSVIAVGQAFRSHDEMRIDFTDPNVERIVVEVRLFSAVEGNDVATAGTLKIADTGVWAVTCTGP